MSAFVESVTGLRVPESVARLTRAQLIKLVHGIEAGAWCCVHCDRLLVEDDYPATTCPGCGQATLPRRCTTRGCSNLCAAVRDATDRGVRYYDPPTYCADCAQQGGRRSRANWCETITPRDVYGHAISYDRDRPARAELDRILAWWISEDDMGRVSRQTMLYVYGPHGCGKSVGVMAHVMRAHISGIVGGLWYASDQDVRALAAGTYSDSSEDKAASAEGFYRAAKADLLVLDGAGNSREQTRSVRAAYEKLLGDRFRRMRATVVISTRRPHAYRGGASAFDWLDGSMPSQFAAVGMCVGVSS